MLQSFPVYTVHSAMHFQDLSFWPSESVVSGQIARPRSGARTEPEAEEEDYVFV